MEGKLREEIIIRSNVLDMISQSKNNCVKSILTAVEISFGDSDNYPIIRKVILDAINDYHRSVCETLERVM